MDANGSARPASDDAAGGGDSQSAGTPAPATILGRLAGLVRSLGGVLGGPGQPARSVAEGTVEDEEARPEKARFDLGAAAMRLGVLRRVTDQLRGAADTYIAAKLDEIEARVDAKLDTIEERIDRKVEALHERLSQARDAELRHRLRLLKLTLIFTVLVALLSLGYKLMAKLMAG